MGPGEITGNSEALPVPEIIRGWKGIAAHFEVSVGTVQNWTREHGLPVRKTGGQRSGVFAYAGELDAWLASRHPAAAPSPEPVAPEPTKPFRYVVWASLAAAILITGAIAGFRWREKYDTAVPASVRRRGEFLVVVDASDRELWRYRVPGIWPPQPEQYGTQQFAIGDLNGDGRTEIVLSVCRGAMVGDCKVVALSQDGHELWQFKPGHEVHDQFRSFSPPYLIEFVQILPAAKRHPPYVAISSAHYFSYPDQVALLDSHGRVVSEYWHSGHLTAMTHGDLYGDGDTELLLGGTDNSTSTATAVALRLDHVRGYEQARGNLAGNLIGPPAAEDEIALLPRSPLVTLPEHNIVVQLTILPAKVTVATIEAPSVSQSPGEMIYELDRHLRVLTAVADMRLGKTYAARFHHDLTPAIVNSWLTQARLFGPEAPALAAR